MCGKFYIGQLAESVDVNPKTIRYWEKVGVLPEPERTDSGYRLYSRKDLQRLQFVKKAKALGLSLDQIKEIIQIRDGGGLPCKHVRHLLGQKLKELDKRIQQMRKFRKELKDYLSEIDQRSKDSQETVICPHIEGYKVETRDGSIDQAG